MRAHIVTLLSICFLSNVAATQEVNQSAPGRKPFQKVSFGFRTQLPAQLPVDSLAQRVFDGPGAIPIAHSWAFLEPPPKDRADTHWRRVVIDAVQGMPIDEAAWNRHAMTMLQDMVRSPGTQLVDKVVRWRPDTAEYELAVRDSAKGESINRRCLGSRVGRPRSVIVCVLTVAPTAEEFASVRASLVLIPQQSAIADK